MIQQFVDIITKYSDTLTYYESFKPEIPLFIAQWYEANICIGISDLVMNLIEPMNDRDVDSERVLGWFRELSEDDESHHEDDLAMITFVKMYLFGYEVI